MKNLKTFEEFLNESIINHDLDLDETDILIIKEVELIFAHFDEKNIDENSLLNYNIFKDYFLNEDEIDDINKDNQDRASYKGGNRTFRNYVGQYLGWTMFFPISVARALIKTVRKKIKIKKMIKDIPEGPKKDQLRKNLNSMTKNQVAYLADMKKSRIAAKTLSKETSENLSYVFSDFLGEKRITKDEKEKIIDDAKKQGVQKGKSTVSKADAISDKLADAPSEKKKEAITKMKTVIKKAKSEWDDVKDELKKLKVQV